MTVEAPATPAAAGAGGPASPAPAGTTAPAPDLTAQVADLTRTVRELGERVEAKDRYITELENDKATLEARVGQPAGPPRTPAPGAAAGGSEGEAIRPEQLSEAVSNMTYVERMRDANPDLVELGLEDNIAVLTAQLQQRERLAFRPALDKAVKTMRERLDKFKGTNGPVVPTEARGEGGGNPPPPAPPPAKPVETQTGEVERRGSRRAAQGL